MRNISKRLNLLITMLHSFPCKLLSNFFRQLPAWVAVAEWNDLNQNIHVRAEPMSCRGLATHLNRRTNPERSQMTFVASGCFCGFDLLVMYLNTVRCSAASMQQFIVAFSESNACSRTPLSGGRG